MAGFIGAIWGRRDTQQVSRDAIVGLRQQLQMIEKKEEYTAKKIEEELKKAKANAVSNKAAATAALKRKKMLETELDKLQGSRFQLEMHVNTLESVKMNQETMNAMKKAADALKHIHGGMDINKVDTTMAQIQEQTQLAEEISNMISTNTMLDMDDEDLARQLQDLQEEDLNERLMGADPTPVHLPPGATRVEDTAKHQPVLQDEEAELRALQAELAM